MIRLYLCCGCVKKSGKSPWIVWALRIVWLGVKAGTTLWDSFSSHELGSESNQDPSFVVMFDWNPVIWSRDIRMGTTQMIVILQMWPNLQWIFIINSDLAKVENLDSAIMTKDYSDITRVSQNSVVLGHNW